MWVEYTDQPEAVRNIDGTITAARFFKCWDTTQAAIINDPSRVFQNGSGGGGLPNYGDKHPQFANAGDAATPILTYYTVSQQGPILLATAYYSNELDTQDFSMTFQRQFVKCPLIRRVRPVTTTGGVETYWEPGDDEIPIPLGRLMVIKRFNRSSFAGGDPGELQQAIVMRIGDLHAVFNVLRRNFNGIPVPQPRQPGGTPTPGDPQPQQDYWNIYFRFEGADIQNIGQRWIEVAYSWSYDPGVPAIEAGDGLAYPMLPSVLYPGMTYSVPPYQSVQVAARADSAATDQNPWRFSSQVVGWRPGREMDWLNLPGMRP